MTNTTIARPDFGGESSESTSPSAWSPGFPWNFSSAPTGPRFPELPAASSGRTLPWEAWFLSFRRKEAGTYRPLVVGISRLVGLVAFRLLHRRDQRLDAISDRPSR